MGTLLTLLVGVVAGMLFKTQILQYAVAPWWSKLKAKFDMWKAQ
jgi:uncharacterized membrane protein